MAPGGDFLFGHFTAADAMFAPVASRFATYEPELGAVAKAYVAAIHALARHGRMDRGGARRAHAHRGNGNLNAPPAERNIRRP